jgi:hypothetical protein
MLQFVLLMLAPAAAQNAILTGPDPRPGPTPVTDKDVLAWSVPKCTDWRQEQRVMEERMKGMTEECVIRPKQRDRGGLDQSHPRP